MDATVSEELLNDNAKLEAKVIRALARLQKKTAYSKKMGKKAGISLRQIVRFLKANYCGLDGDVETQVMTALGQCIKNGIVCALHNGRYLLLGPKTKTMITNCFSRKLHGASCACAKKVPCQNACCMVNVNIEKQEVSRKRKSRRKNPNSESLEVETQLADADSILCNNCIEVHQGPEKSTRKKCSVPIRKTFTAPFDTFSPRDEINYNKAAIKTKKSK